MRMQTFFGTLTRNQQVKMPVTTEPVMKRRTHNNIASIFLSTITLAGPTLALLLGSGLTDLRAQGTDNRAPAVPPAIEVPGDTNKVSFHVYAVGFQIYTNDTTTFAWGLFAPEARLYDADGNLVGIHYAYAYNAAGAPIPAWETVSGSLVVGARIASAPGASGSIPWLLLQATHTEGPGFLEPTTFVQRVNTSGGVMPPPVFLPGQEARVPYTAEYFFYRSK